MIVVINTKTKERLHLTRAQFLRALNRVDQRTRRGIVRAVLKQAKAGTR